jgi:hypothetical protein
MNISRADRPPVLKSELFCLDCNLENTPPHLNRGAIPANAQVQEGISPGLNGSNRSKLRNRMRFSNDFYPGGIIGAEFLLASSHYIIKRPNESYDFLMSSVVKSKSPIWYGFIKSSKNISDRLHHSGTAARNGIPPTAVSPIFFLNRLKGARAHR